MNRVTTFAPVPAFGKSLPNFCTTVRTELRRSCRIYFYNHGTSNFSLVREDHPKVVPANMGYRLGQPVVPQHPSGIEAFQGEQTITIDQSISHQVMMLTSQILRGTERWHRCSSGNCSFRKPGLATCSPLFVVRKCSKPTSIPTAGF
jgi:hypothetical protein